MSADRRTAGGNTADQWRAAAAVLREHAAKFDRMADEVDPWLVPPEHRPTCPLNNEPCTSWTCLVDVCGRADSGRTTP